MHLDFPPQSPPCNNYMACCMQAAEIQANRSDMDTLMYYRTDAVL